MSSTYCSRLWTGDEVVRAVLAAAGRRSRPAGNARWPHRAARTGCFRPFEHGGGQVDAFHRLHVRGERQSQRARARRDVQHALVAARRGQAHQLAQLAFAGRVGGCRRACDALVVLEDRRRVLAVRPGRGRPGLPRLRPRGRGSGRPGGSVWLWNTSRQWLSSQVNWVTPVLAVKTATWCPPNSPRMRVPMKPPCVTAMRVALVRSRGRLPTIWASVSRTRARKLA